MGCTDVKCTPPSIVEYSFKIESMKGCLIDNSSAIIPLVDSNKISKDTVQPVKDTTQKTEIAPTKNDDNKGTQSTEGRSWWSIFVLGFLGGLAALLMPCVFPMIPMTVSFFTKQS